MVPYCLNRVEPLVFGSGWNFGNQALGSPLGKCECDYINSLPRAGLQIGYEVVVIVIVAWVAVALTWMASAAATALIGIQVIAARLFGLGAVFEVNIVVERV